MGTAGRGICAAVALALDIRWGYDKDLMAIMEPINILLLTVVVLLFFGPGLYARARGVKPMAPARLKEALQKRRKEIVVLDVRTDGEWAGGRIKGAYHLPLGRLDGGLDKLDGLKGREVVCVCASGKRSALAAIKLKKAGFPTVYNLSGGMMRWGRADVERG